MDIYEDYLRTEWELFERSPDRARIIAAAIGDHEVRRVLDVGCGAGQELLPFVATSDVFGIGVDRAPHSAVVASRLFARRPLRGRVRFVTGRAEHLPCRSGAVDVVVCRLALPYTRNAAALTEMARVLRPGGMILLQFHHARFYVRSLMRALAALQLKAAMHNVAVLAAGAVYVLSGRQPRARLIDGEVFQTERSLRRELARCGISVRAIAPASNPQTPLVIGVKVP